MKSLCSYHYWVLIAFFGVLFLGAVLGNSFAKRRADCGKCPTVTDTTYITKVEHDTTYLDRPVPVASKQLKDSIRILASLNGYYVSLIDSLLDEIGNPPMDTIVEITLPREQKEYKDSTYHAWVSGYDPALDSLRVYNKTVYQTITVHERPQPKRWGIGIQAGVGVGVHDNSVFTTPYIGVGVTYNIFAF